MKKERVSGRDWLATHEGQSLQAYLGSHGCQTHLISDLDELLALVCTVFAIDVEKELRQVHAVVSELGKGERRRRIRESVNRLWPTPTSLWPYDASIRFIKAKKRKKGRK